MKHEEALNIVHRLCPDLPNADVVAAVVAASAGQCQATLKDVQRTNPNIDGYLFSHVIWLLQSPPVVKAIVCRCDARGCLVDAELVPVDPDKLDAWMSSSSAKRWTCKANAWN